MKMRGRRKGLPKNEGECKRVSEGGKGGGKNVKLSGM